MYRATNKTTGKDIISLDPKWTSQVEYLRKLGRKNEIVCPGCREPVRLRAGEKRRWHFAHKHLRNCTFGFESPTLLNARAVLYRMLTEKFGEAVSIEKSTNAGILPREIDCWIETEQGKFAYWIFDTAKKPDGRDQLWAGFNELNAQAKWIFVSDMLREDETHIDCIHLTTTEREFACQTDYDEIRSDRIFFKRKSLHYVDPENEALITYRRLHLVHSPQLYQGDRIETKISSVLVSPKSGEFVHPGEQEQLDLFREEKARIEKENLERERKAKEFFSHLSDKKRIPPQDVKHSEDLSQTLKPSFGKVKATCVICGQITDDYWFLNRSDNTCQCRECYQQGKYLEH